MQPDTASVQIGGVAKLGWQRPQRLLQVSPVAVQLSHCLDQILAPDLRLRGTVQQSDGLARSRPSASDVPARASPVCPRSVNPTPALCCHRRAIAAAH